ncbi:hypothetical protein ACFPZ0_14505 [Streptomonospora nanhaiensis]|uniref:hypothetical protein n=1 Tax=Streptomonospora nanhaiensis TaxID=1323731 RepID=UPI001C9923EE|nr:hypothetical protein [Streptomonospora nanhaiensis]MBX9390609.1 hypothetical protein [Streptomonospora nanhaiensis]
MKPFSPPSPPPAAPGWSARIHAGRLELRAPEESVYAGTLTTWPSLEAALRSHGIAVVLVGHLALGWGANPLAAAEHAAGQGECAAGVVTVTAPR